MDKSHSIDEILRQLRPPERADARGAELVPDVLQGIVRMQRRQLQRRHEWALQVAALLLALGIGVLRGEFGSEDIQTHLGWPTPIANETSQ